LGQGKVGRCIFADGCCCCVQDSIFSATRPGRVQGSTLHHLISFDHIFSGTLPRITYGL
jgi:hypothetical protein